MFCYRSMKKMRTSPSLFDYCFITCLNNLKVLRRIIGKVLLSSNKKLEIIDIGCGDKPFEVFFSEHNYTGVDFNPVNSTVIKHDLSNKLPFPDNSFDIIILSEVLEHVPRPFFVLEEVNRISKCESFIYISTPFALQIHGSPYDYFRYTKYFYFKISKLYDWELIEFRSSNSIFSSLLLLINQYTLYFNLPNFIISPFWFLINIISLSIDKSILIFANKSLQKKLFDSFPSGYCSVFKKDP